MGNPQPSTGEGIAFGKREAISPETFSNLINTATLRIPKESPL
ncbi:hypothetical protein RCS94_02625 [Orbaceae bacterium ac157xtp]